MLAGRPVDQTIASPELDPASWVDAHGEYLYRFALARVHDPETAEEVLQDTLLAALSARHAFRGEASERSWLTAILKRKIVDWFQEVVRRRGAQEPLSDRSIDDLFTPGGKWRRKPDDWSADDPGREISRAEFRDVLSACLVKLPPRLRNAFMLRYVAEQSTDEICQAVGATAENLWVMLHRARVRLWRCLTVNWFGDDSRESSEEHPP